MTIVEFLLAMYAQDEEAALRICPGRDAANGHWHRGSVQDEVVRAIDPLNADHILRYDPARVLADIEAKRLVVRFLSDLEQGNYEDPTASSVAYSVLCRLALPYADHPDFREEWKP